VLLTAIAFCRPCRDQSLTTHFHPWLASLARGYALMLPRGVLNPSHSAESGSAYYLPVAPHFPANIAAALRQVEFYSSGKREVEKLPARSNSLCGGFLTSRVELNQITPCFGVLLARNYSWRPKMPFPALKKG